MATLADVVRKRRSSGQSRTGSLLGSLKDKFKEKIDPRKFLNQTGVLTALFPSLKAYKAGGESDSSKNIQSKSVELINSSISLSNDALNTISKNTEIMAKNSLLLPVMARDMNVLRQNMSKVVRLFGMQPTNKADRFFKKSSEREAEYESKFIKSKSKDVTKPSEEQEKSGLLKSFLGFLSKVIGPILTVFTALFKTLGTVLKNIVGLLVRPLMGIIGKAMISVVGIIATFTKKIAGAILSLFRGIKFKGIMSAFFASPFGRAALVAGIIGLGLFELKGLYKENTKETQEAFDLNAKVAAGTATPEEKSRLDELKSKYAGLDALLDPSKAGTDKTASPIKQQVDAVTSKHILGLLDSEEESDKEEGNTQLKMLGVSREALQEYTDKMYGPSATPESRKEVGTLQQVEQRLRASREHPEEQPSIGAGAVTQPDQSIETVNVTGSEKIPTLDLTTPGGPTIVQETGKNLQGQLIDAKIKDIKEQKSVTNKNAIETLFSSGSSTDVQSGSFGGSRMSEVSDVEIRKYFTGLFGAAN